MPRDMPAIQAPSNGASGTQQRRRSNQETPCYRIGSRGKNPSSARHEGKSCLRQGVVRARKQRRAKNCRSFALTCSAGLTFQWTTFYAALSLTVIVALASPPALRILLTLSELRCASLRETNANTARIIRNECSQYSRCIHSSHLAASKLAQGLAPKPSPLLSLAAASHRHQQVSAPLRAFHPNREQQALTRHTGV